ncbi:MAG: hypothetical protein QM820_45070 [Minicystis sp.]
MAFKIPESLLLLLRARREDQRRQRAERAVTTPVPDQGGNFIDTIRDLFAGRAPVEDTVQRYVHAMNSWQDEIEGAYDAFLLDPGMGPMTYLTADGRILQDERGWDGDSIVEVTGYDAHAALVVGARKTGIAELLDLMPAAPDGAVACPKCKGTRIAELAPGMGLNFPCAACDCRGWVHAG